ncbi:23S rRNA (pseudouridine(1915)-N(3))-methyltransferase RlmH [Spiroplasma culicicola]|uniref:Ribosomal RNA large subunit methyltransferase H n=1 Tax=Spiroplasma culicicola AES-1 TaxID=1276246 RepID=W6AG41_9MOLU|nr:23S rRNA (pseudouridine(1915)-N(3))-methyltransferase RlmH [Spiroplasma culicicola]AHI52679.1 rRNA large subunit methyltransferase [Spiroplasma culicicola AES-1]
MKIKVMCFNKISSEFSDAYSFFVEKINKVADLEVIEIPEVNLGDIKSNRVKNEETLLKKMDELKDFEIFLLDINARQYTSNDFAKAIEKNKDFKGAKMAFIIGPSDGFSVEFRIKFTNKISFGPMTFPYSLIRTMLVEQIYRSFKIIRNEPYHK